MENSNSETILFTTLLEHKGLRLDTTVALIAGVHSRSRAQKLIQSQCVLVNGRVEKSSFIVTEGLQIQLKLPTISNELVASPGHLDILFEDQDLAVVNKPSNLVVHPAHGHTNDTLVNLLLHNISNLSMGFHENRPGIVHRLDKETSGLLVIAKNDLAHSNLADQFKNRTVKREYFALVFGVPKKSDDRIVTHICRDTKNRKKFQVHNTQGKLAITNYSVLKSFSSETAELRIKLETGRTHQIRVHLSNLGYPILGDKLYGSNSKVKQLKSKILRDCILDLSRIALHAAKLGFKHPRTDREMDFVTDWPKNLDDLRRLL